MHIVLNSRFLSLRTIGMVVGVVAMALVVGPAYAQLRSGRTQRTIYQDQLPQQHQAVAISPRGQRTPEIAMASHTTPVESYSILEGTTDVVVNGHAADFAGDYASDYASDFVGTSGCDCGACDACDAGNFGMGNGMFGNVGGCGCGMCQVNAIAPTCGSACQPSCGPLLGFWRRLSVRAEVPLYWRRSAEPPPLVTTSNVGTPQSNVGILGLPSTRVLLGGSSLDEGLNAGVRLTFSTWISHEENLGIVFRYWNAGDQEGTYNFGSSSIPNLARPFRDTSATPAVNETQLIAFQANSTTAPSLSGGIQILTQSSVDGLEISLKRLLYQDRFTRVDWLYGYQRVRIDEGLQVSTASTDVASGVSIAVADQFRTQNEFNGFAYGLTSTRKFACWQMETLFRLGMGNLRREVDIGGRTLIRSGGQSNATSQGLLARNTNSREFVDDTFVLIPEVGINFGYQIRSGLDFTFGYNFMHVPKVAQASQQINDDLAVNLSNPLVGAQDPAFVFDEQSYGLHSLGLGLQLRY